MFDEIRRNLRYAIRGLLKAPAFTLTAAITLALGIGATVALFSIVYAVLLKPLPYGSPERLVLIRAETAVTGTRRPLPVSIRLSEFDAWKHAQTFERPALFTRATHALATRDGTEVLEDVLVSTEFFSTMEGQLAAGRSLAAEDDAMPSVVISSRLARRLFNSPAQAVGQRLTLTGRPFTIVGVAADEFRFPERATDAWIPARFVGTYDARDFGFQMIARVRGETSIPTIDAEVESIEKGLSQASGQLKANVVRLADQLTAPVSRTLAVLFAAVVLLLVVACVNLANLLLARNASRSRDLAIRTSLGASRARLLGESFTETSCLAGLGTVCGIALAYGLVRVAVASTETFLPNVESATVDRPTLIFALAVMVASALAAGATPAIVNALSAHAPLTVTASSRPHQRVRRVLGVMEWSVAFVLLVTTILLGRSLIRLMTTDLGVSTDHVVTASLNFAYGSTPSESDVVRRTDDLLDKIKKIPGVQTAGVGTSLPPQTSRIRMTLKTRTDSVDYAASAVPVSPEYFPALRIRLLQGRFFTEQDDTSHPDAIIMSQDAARRFFGPGDVIGKTMNIPHATWTNVRRPSTEMTLVGVIDNVKYSGLASPPDDAVYRPFAQQPWTAPFLVVRTNADPAALVPVIRREIASADRDIVVGAVKTLSDIMDDAAAQPRTQSNVLIAFSALALAMSAVGLYGVISYSVAQRTTEIGTRIALGATPADLQRLVFREGLTIAVIGLAIGLAATAVVVRLLRSSLYGISPADPLSFVAATMALLAIAAIATYFPARRAAGVNPLVAIRWN